MFPTSTTKLRKNLIFTLGCTTLAALASPAGGDELTRAEVLEAPALVEAVLARNPDMEAMQAAWQASQEVERGSGAWDDPMLGASLAPLSLGGEARTGYAVQLEQRFPFPGKRGLEKDAAREGARMAEYGRETVRLQLARLTVRAFADYAAAHEALVLKHRQEDLARETVTVAEGLYTVGRVPQQEALQAELERVRLEHDRIVLETDWHTARARLNALLHREQDALLPPPAPLPERVALPEPNTDEQSHPRLQTLEAGIAAADAEEALARREYWPDFTIMAGYDNMWEMSEHRWMAGASINVPIQRTPRRAAVDEARYRSAEQRARLRGEQAQLKEAVTIALHRAREAHHDLVLLEERTLPVARAQVEAARSAYEAGQVTLTALLDAQRSLWAFEEREIKARAELSAYLADYDYARGLLPRLDPNTHHGEAP